MSCVALYFFRLVTYCGSIENGDAADDPAGLQHASSCGADDLLETKPPGVGVIPVRAGELAEADGHHLHEAAFHVPYEHRVGLDAVDDHDMVGAEGVHCAALLDEGIGIAIKVEDGAQRAQHAARGDR